jgi:hypothetical protein
MHASFFANVLCEMCYCKIICCRGKQVTPIVFSVFFAVLSALAAAPVAVLFVIAADSRFYEGRFRTVQWWLCSSAIVWAGTALCVCCCTPK